MKIIIIENIVYKVSEKQFKEITEVQNESEALPFGADIFIEEYLLFNKDNYKKVGEIDIDFDA